MADPRTGRFTLFNNVAATTTTELHTITGNTAQYMAGSILLEVVGATAPNWTLAFQGKATENGTYTNLDYIQVWQAAAATLSKSDLTVNDTTRRFYIIPNAPPFVQAVATRTAGNLTVYFSYTSNVFTQWLLQDAQGYASVVTKGTNLSSLDVVSGSLPAGTQVPGSTTNRVLAVMPYLSLDGNTTMGAQRTPNTFKTATATASGNTALWTPATGKKFRLMGYALMVTGNAAQTTGGNFEVTLQDGTSAIGAGMSLNVPATGATTLGGFGIVIPDLGNGFLSATANNVLNINLGAALTAGECRGVAWGVEE